VFDFSVELDGSSDPTNLRGRNVKITHADTGLISIQLPMKFAQMVCGICTLQDADPTDAGAEIVSYTVSTGVVVIRTFTMADDTGVTFTEADLDGPRLNVHLVMQLSRELAKTWT
jgi:hypothetical protein